MPSSNIISGLWSSPARDEGRGKEALKSLNAEGLDAKFHQLDIDDSASIDRLRDFLKEQYGGLDVLVNNAGIAFKVRNVLVVTFADLLVTYVIFPHK